LYASAVFGEGALQACAAAWPERYLRGFLVMRVGGRVAPRAPAAAWTHGWGQHYPG